MSTLLAMLDDVAQSVVGVVALYGADPSPAGPDAGGRPDPASPGDDMGRRVVRSGVPPAGMSIPAATLPIHPMIPSSFTFRR